MPAPFLETASLATATIWNIDHAHSAAEFKVKHMMIANVIGRFTAVSGIVRLDGEDVTRSSAEVIIEMASMSSGAERDAHLKTADFFNAQQFPTLSFVSTSVTRQGAEKLA